MMTDTETARTIVKTAANSHLYFYWTRQFTLIFYLIGISIFIGVSFVDDITAWNLMRYASVGLGIYMAVFTMRVVILYNAIHKLMVGTSKLLPGHIRMMAISYFMLIIAAMSWSIHWISHTPYIWGTPFTFTAFVIGTYGIGLIWRHELRMSAEQGLWNEREKRNANEE